MKGDVGGLLPASATRADRTNGAPTMQISTRSPLPVHCCVPVPSQSEPAPVTFAPAPERVKSGGGLRSRLASFMSQSTNQQRWHAQRWPSAPPITHPRSHSAVGALDMHTMLQVNLERARVDPGVNFAAAQ